MTFDKYRRSSSSCVGRRNSLLAIRCKPVTTEMVVIKKNSCRICLKVFCCSDCRDNHENSKHPKPKCSLCVRQTLPFGVASEKEDSLKKSELLCHLVFNHLPLRCKLCGDRFRKNEDLIEAQPCRWWNEPRRKGSKTGIEEAEKKLPLTPQILQSSEANKSLRSVDTSSIIRLKQENFDSPPELARHTSTPVHHPAVALLPGQKIQPGIGGLIPQFSLKTPSSFDKRYSSSASSATSSCSTFESRYYTGISQLMSAGKNSNDLDRVNQSEADPSWNSPTYSILKKLEPLNVMKPEGLDSIEKRVRFSDQCLVPESVVAASETSAYFAENEIFFEARESLEDDVPDSNNNNNDEKNVAAKADLSSKKEEKSPPSEPCACCRHHVSDNSLETSANKSTSSSRVVMMLLVEKTDSSKSLSSLDLAPLIDSGLKKLEESASSKLNEESDVKAFVKEHSFFGCASEKPIDTRPESKIEDVPLKDVSSNSSSSSSGIFSAMARVVRSALQKLPGTSYAVSSAASISSSSSSSRNLSREPLPQGACSSASSVTSTSSLSIATTAEVVTVGSSRSTTTASQIVLQRSASKRPRDRIDSGEEPQNQQLPRDSAGNSSGSPRQEVVSSPAAKRHRGWYRIRAREPIARMRDRQLVPQSPRGASLETQRFQQGSLTIGDNTFLPLPSRAHQSTQTED